MAIVVSDEETVPLYVNVPLSTLNVRALFVAMVTLLSIVVPELVDLTVVGALRLMVALFTPVVFAKTTA